MTAKRLTSVGILAALCFVATYIHIPVNFGGSNAMIHLGTTAIYLSAVLLGKDAGWAGAIGCALFDILDPAYAAWVIPTFIIKGLQGYTAGRISFMGNKKGSSFTQNLLAFTAGAIVSLAGYFLVDWLVFYNLPVALQKTAASLITSAIGIGVSIILVPIIVPAIKKAKM